MNTTKLIVCLSFAWAWVSGLCPIISAQESAEYFLYKDEKVWALEKGGIVPLTENVKLSNNIVVRTNGTFQIGSHRPRPFLDGQILGADGMLLSPHGQIEPVLDHVALVFGETVVAVNGEKIAVDQNIQLGTDKVLTPDRVLLGGERGWMRVIDGQLFTTDGKTIPAVLTVNKNALAFIHRV